LFLPRTIFQIRIGNKTSEKLKNWILNQENASDAAKRVIEHFIRLYGDTDIDSDEVQLQMAADLLTSVKLKKIGAEIPVFVQQTVASPPPTPAEELKPDPEPEPEAEPIKEVKKEPEPEVAEQPKEQKRVKNRGKIDV
jgi:hypothetical protein